MSSPPPGAPAAPGWARGLAATALVALVALVLAIQLAALERRLGEPTLAELGAVRSIAEFSPLDPAAADNAAVTRYAVLPSGWARDRRSAPLLLVYVDGVQVPFRRRAAASIGEIAYYYEAAPDRLGLAVRCAPGAPCRQLTVIVRDGAFDAALGFRRMLRSPAALLPTLLSLAGSVLWLGASARRWGPRDAVPAALGVIVATAPLVLGSRRGSAAALAVSLALLGAPILTQAGRRVRGRWSALVPGARLALGSGLLLGIVFAPLAWQVFPPYLAAPPSASDHAAYLRLAQDPTLLPHFLYPLLVAMLAGFSTELDALSRAAQIVLTALVVSKLAISLAFAHELLSRAGSRLSLAAAAGFAGVLFVVAPLPNWWQFPRVFLGQLSPTVWHNPTAIASLPFAVGAFWLLGFASRPSLRIRLVGCGLLLLSVLAKPNFALAFLPAVLLLALLGRFDRTAALLAAVVTLPLLGWQYLHWSAFGVTRLASSGILTLRPLAVWRLYSPDPLASLLLSIAFPASLALFARRDARHPGALAAAWLLTAVAIAQFGLLAEAGDRWRHGNYYWGTVPAVYLLFLVSLCELCSPREVVGRRRAGRWLCWSLLGLHVASGVLFYVRSLLGHGYRA